MHSHQLSCALHCLTVILTNFLSRLNRAAVVFYKRHFDVRSSQTFLAWVQRPINKLRLTSNNTHEKPIYFCPARVQETRLTCLLRSTSFLISVGRIPGSKSGSGSSTTSSSSACCNEERTNNLSFVRSITIAIFQRFPLTKRKPTNKRMRKASYERTAYLSTE